MDLICIELAHLDPDTEQENRPKFTNKPDFQPFRKAFIPVRKVCFMTITHTKNIFQFFQPFVKAKSDQDQDPDPH